MNRRETILIRVSKEEKEMVKELQKEYAINISALLRNHIRNYYEKVHS